MTQPFPEVDLPPALRARGRSLAGIGVPEIAWPPAAALELLDYLGGKAIAVLGGDVVEWIGEQPRHTGDNWYSQPDSGESFATFAARSHAETAAYIRGYQEAGRSIGYVLVVADRLANRAT